MRGTKVVAIEWLGTFAAGLLFLGAAGCGSKPAATVSGQVTYKGMPVSGGAITFHGDGGFVRSAYIDPGGRYMIVGAPPGPVKVTVISSQPGTAPVSAPGGKAASNHPSGKGGGAVGGGGIAVPPKYKDPNQSGLSYTLTAGEQSIDIPLN